MKCRTIFFAIIAILLLANIALSDPVSDEEEKCHYIHLALYSGFGPNDPFLAEYNGVTLPHYIGYITIISDWRDKSFRSLSFTSTTDLPIPWVERFFATVVEARKVWLDSGPEVASEPTPMDQLNFMQVLLHELDSEGVRDLFDENYFMLSRTMYPESVLGAEDFEFAKPCVLRPFAEPPEYCKDVRTKLVNQDALYEKCDDHYSEYIEKYFDGLKN